MHAKALEVELRSLLGQQALLVSLSFTRFFAYRTTFGSHRPMARVGMVLALASVALGVAVMEVSLSIVSGFEQAMLHKVVGFASDVQVGAYLPEADVELRPLPRQAPYLAALPTVLQDPDALITPFISKAAILQGKESLEGISLKGVDASWNRAPLQASLVQGSLPAFGTPAAQGQLLISRRQANMLSLQVGQKARLYFLEGQVRARPAVITGIYDTGLTEFDEVVAYCDLALLQQLMHWQPDQVQGFEVYLSHGVDAQLLKQRTDALNRLLPPDQRARPVQELYPEIFDWLRLQHQNVYFILVLMTLVAMVNMASALLILITERTVTIGLLKSLGATQSQVQRIFLWNAFYLISLGVALGNLLGLGLIGLQQRLGLFQLDPEAYFVRELPVAWEWTAFVLVNLGVIGVCTLCMLLPTRAISGISAVRALRFR